MCKKPRAQKPKRQSTKDRKPLCTVNTLVFQEDSNDGVSFDLLVHHESKNTHHGGTSVVQLNSTLANLSLRTKVIPPKVKSSVTEVSWEFGLTRDILHDEQLKKTNEKDDLANSGRGNSVGSSNGGISIRERIELQWKYKGNDSVRGGLSVRQ